LGCRPCNWKGVERPVAVSGLGGRVRRHCAGPWKAGGVVGGRVAGMVVGGSVVCE
jgi:hypothetical protein